MSERLTYRGIDGKVINYTHHDASVMVGKHCKGEHRNFCLCYSCSKLDIEDRQNNCEIANAIFDNCIAFNIVTPVWECPGWEKAE